jgi:hypothetical protein
VYKGFAHLLFTPHKTWAPSTFAIGEADKLVDFQVKLKEIVAENMACLTNMQETVYYFLSLQWIKYAKVFQESTSIFQEGLYILDTKVINIMTSYPTMEDMNTSIEK